MKIDEKLKDEKLWYNINREAGTRKKIDSESYGSKIKIITKKMVKYVNKMKYQQQ